MEIIFQPLDPISQRELFFILWGLCASAKLTAWTTSHQLWITRSKTLWFVSRSTHCVSQSSPNELLKQLPGASLALLISTSFGTAYQHELRNLPARDKNTRCQTCVERAWWESGLYLNTSFTFPLTPSAPGAFLSSSPTPLPLVPLE